MAMAELLQQRTTTMDERLAGRTLPRLALPGTALAVLLADVLLFAATDLSGLLAFALTSAVGYVAAQTALSLLVEGRRRAVDRLCTAMVSCAFAAACLPLVLIGWHTVQQGIRTVDLTFLTHSMFRVNPQGPGGGVYHAIAGTLMQSLLATVLAAPLGILAAIYLVEYGGRHVTRLVSFFVDVMTGVPSIVAGLFVYTSLVLVVGVGKSGFAGAAALAIVMLPVVVRSTEQMLRLVPSDLREAACALGIPKWRTIVSVVLPSAMGGIVTGVMLGVARVAGETAPLLLLVGINQKIEFNPFPGSSGQRPQESLPTLIFEQFGIAAGNTASEPFQRAWGAAFVLIVLVGLLNLGARFITHLIRR